MTAEVWVRQRLPEAPPHLLSAMVATVAARPEPTVPAALAAGALSLYRKVLSGAGGREDAFPLLVADALLTHAFQAQAELDPEQLESFAAEWGGASRLAELGR